MTNEQVKAFEALRDLTDYDAATVISRWLKETGYNKDLLEDE